jgi:alkylhydroperoxidase/carboxymuconolactone decarboxylase family protein YurZ
VAEPFQELRALAATVPDDGGPLADYLEKVRTRAYTVTDGDVAALKRAGASEDEIFEATAAVAAAEGLRRLEAALRVIG